MFKRFAVGFAAGYVFGARAGEKRYEEMTQLAERALELPWVQRLADGGQAIAVEQGRQILSNLRERARWIDGTGDDSEEEGSYEDDEGAYEEDEEDADDPEKERV